MIYDCVRMFDQKHVIFIVLWCRTEFRINFNWNRQVYRIPRIKIMRNQNKNKIFHMYLIHRLFIFFLNPKLFGPNIEKFVRFWRDNQFSKCFFSLSLSLSFLFDIFPSLEKIANSFHCYYQLYTFWLINLFQRRRKK